MPLLSIKRNEENKEVETKKYTNFVIGIKRNEDDRCWECEWGEREKYNETIKYWNKVFRFRKESQRRMKMVLALNRYEEYAL